MLRLPPRRLRVIGLASILLSLFCGDFAGTGMPTAAASPISDDFFLPRAMDIPESDEREVQDVSFEVFVCGFQDSGEPTVDIDMLVEYLNSNSGARGYWSEVSHGLVDMSFSENPFYRIDKPASSYEGLEGKVMTQAREDCIEGRPDYDGETVWDFIIILDYDLGVAYGSRYFGRRIVISQDMLVGTTISHEIGHTFGWMHSLVPDDPVCEYCSWWDIMSVGLCDAPRSPGTYGCAGQHPIAFWKYMSEFLPESGFIEVPRGQSQEVELYANAVADPDAMRLVIMEHERGGFYTVEYRSRIGQDRHLADEGVILHRLKEVTARPYPTLLVEPSGRPSARTAMHEGDTYVRHDGKVEVHVLETAETSVRILVINDLDYSPPLFFPALLNGD